MGVLKSYLSWIKYYLGNGIGLEEVVLAIIIERKAIAECMKRAKKVNILYKLYSK